MRMGFLSVKDIFSPGFALALVNTSQTHLPESVLARSGGYSRASQLFQIRPFPGGTLSKADGLRFKIRKVLPQSLFGILGKAEVQAPHLISPELQG